ncbi:MAG TPA: flagellar basal body rod protein FlgB [Bdellovibrionota bacterium]|nr:flagellar basal body rod protein FlgB [Bdellovibrionota bacterium]
MSMIDAATLTLEKVLDLRSRAHATHVSNIANANVAGYKAKTVEFEAELQRAIEHAEGKPVPMIRKDATVARDLASLDANIFEDGNAAMSGDGNTVNVDSEQADLAKNYIGYQGAVKLLNKKMAMQKYVITEGGR